MIETEAHRRGQRLIQIRNTLGLSRLKFCEKFGFANTTVAQWETLSGISPGINERHARRIIRAVESAGLIVQEQWLLYGSGEPPYLLRPAEKPPLNLFHYACMATKLAAIVEETLHQLGSGFQAWQLSDNAMQPEFNRGDYVIGIMTEKSQWLELFNNHACLVTLEDHTHMVRVLREYRPQQYLLIATNHKAANTAPQIIPASKIIAMSQIIIHYRWGQI